MAKSESRDSPKPGPVRKGVAGFFDWSRAWAAGPSCGPLSCGQRPKRNHTEQHARITQHFACKTFIGSCIAAGGALLFGRAPRAPVVGYASETHSGLGNRFADQYRALDPADAESSAGARSVIPPFGLDRTPWSEGTMLCVVLDVPLRSGLGRSRGSLPGRGQP